MGSRACPAPSPPNRTPRAAAGPDRSKHCRRTTSSPRAQRENLPSPRACLRAQARSRRAPAPKTHPRIHTPPKPHRTNSSPTTPTHHHPTAHPGRQRDRTGASIAGEQHHPLEHSAKALPLPEPACERRPDPAEPRHPRHTPESIPPKPRNPLSVDKPQPAKSPDEPPATRVLDPDNRSSVATDNPGCLSPQSGPAW